MTVRLPDHRIAEFKQVLLDHLRAELNEAHQELADIDRHIEEIPAVEGA